MRLTWALTLALSALVCAPAHAAFIDADATFTGGIFGSFNITFASNLPGTQLTGVDFNLLTGAGGGPGLSLFLDPTGAAPGYLTNQNLASLSGAAATGFIGGSGITNGSTAFSLGFNDFTAGETYSFLLDVDHAVVLNACPSSPFAAAIACAIGNAAATTNGSVVNGAEFAGTGLTFHFQTIYGLKSFSTQFGQTGALSASGNTFFEAPEPSSWALMGSGFGLLMWRFRRRSGGR